VAKVEVVIYSKPDCHLCDEIKAQLKKLQRRHRFELSEVNILEDPEALNRFKEEIPVVFINGRKAFKFHLDEQEFLRKLQRNPHIQG
jgi:glutaredoxin